MPASYTSLLKFAKPGLGDTGWGTTVNGGFTDMTEQALTGAIDVAVTAGGTVPLPAIANGASSDARNQFLTITGILTSVQTATVRVPPGTYDSLTGVGNYKLYFVKNSAGGAVTVETSGGTGVVIPNGASMALRVTNTGVEVVADQFVNLNASSNVSFDGGTFVFNESGADKDARFEGDTDANLLFLDASTDRVGIGTAAPAAKLDVNGNTSVTGNVTLTGDVVLADDQYLYWGVGDGSAYVRGNSTSDYVSFGTVGVERMRLDSSGNVGIGTTSPGKKLEVSGSILCTNNNGLAIRSTAGTSNDVVTLDSSNVLIFGGGGGINSLQFWNNGLERARIDANGSFITSVNNVAPSLSSNNTLSFELTSNTSLKIVVRGTDGTTRSVSLTLA